MSEESLGNYTAGRPLLHLLVLDSSALDQQSLLFVLPSSIVMLQKIALVKVAS